MSLQFFFLVHDPMYFWGGELKFETHQQLVGGFNPIWKILVKLDRFPRDANKNIWKHHLPQGSLEPQNWLFWGPWPCYTGSNPSIGGSKILRVDTISVRIAMTNLPHESSNGQQLAPSSPLQGQHRLCRTSSTRSCHYDWWAAWNWFGLWLRFFPFRYNRKHKHITKPKHTNKQLWHLKKLPGS